MKHEWARETPWRDSEFTHGMKRYAFALALLVAVLASCLPVTLFAATECANHNDATRVLAEAFETRASNIQVCGSGQVERVLTDDTNGSRHQRFIVRLASGQTLLIAHNIDLAPRIESLRASDQVTFFGEYEWNERGGVIHWTHHDPDGRHVSGWIRHDGRVYQ